jgi:stearoyl-CoA desaturase (delta-9 desaturase)
MFPMLHDLPLWVYIAVTLAMTHVTIASVTIFLHRCQAHRAVDLSALPSHFFRFWLWLTTGQNTRQWVAVHRKHHARVETEGDPHSPKVWGIRKVLLEGAELYRREARNPETVAKYGHGAPDDWVERNLYGRHPNLGIVLMFVIDVALFGAPGITIWAVQMMWIPFFAAGVINGAGHYWGYRNYECEDASTNIVPIGILIGGEELHNNHHAFASSARFSSRWFEFDIGWLYIRLMSLLGLARVRKLAPRAIVDQNKESVDLDTVRAIIGARMQVMAHYTRDVVKTAYRMEKANANRAARRLLRRGRRLLIRHEQLIDAAGRTRLEEMLKNHHSLQVVYEYRQRLQALWQQRMAQEEGLVQALQEWCRSAEATGIQCLADFARRLRGYTLVTT